METKYAITKKSQMLELAKQCLESNTTIRNFCRERNLTYSTIRYWIWKYKRKSNDRIRNEQAEGFIPIEIIQDLNGTKEKLEITFPNGVEMKLPLKTDPCLLKNLITIF